jgi:hypothetical protein
METPRHGTGFIGEEAAVPPVTSIFLDVGLTAASRRGGMRAGFCSMSCLSTRKLRVAPKQDKPVMRPRLLAEELPLACLHKMNTVHKKLSWLLLSRRPCV